MVSGLSATSLWWYYILLLVRLENKSQDFFFFFFLFSSVSTRRVITRRRKNIIQRVPSGTKRQKERQRMWLPLLGRGERRKQNIGEIERKKKKEKMISFPSSFWQAAPYYVFFLRHELTNFFFFFYSSFSFSFIPTQTSALFKLRALASPLWNKQHAHVRVLALLDYKF